MSLEVMREYWDVLCAADDEIQSRLLDAIQGIPRFAAILASMDPAVMAARREISRSHQEAAYVRGDWGPYLADLREQGAIYADLDIPIEDWYALVVVYRPLVRQRLIAQSGGDPARLDALLDAMSTSLDRAMGAITEGYLQAWERRWRAANLARDELAQAVEHAPLGVVVYERLPDTLSYVERTRNPAAVAVRERFGRPPDAGPDPTTVADLDAALLTRSVRVCDRTATDPEGREGTWTMWSVPIHQDRVALLFQDVSEERRVQRLVTRYLQDLERSNRELDAFAYIASHDLRAPLRDVDNLAAWILEDVGETLPPASQEHLRKLQARVRRMEDLLVDLLDYSRAGRVSERPQAFNVLEAVEAAVEQAAVPPTFAVRIAGRPILMTSPRTPLQVVVRNLLTNAAKHHDRGAGVIEVAVRPAGDRVEISVSDDGPGIPAEYHERAFQMFQTLRPRDEVEGTGMGLALVRKLVAVHGGEVSLQSQGRGTTVRFTWSLTVKEHG